MTTHKSAHGSGKHPATPSAVVQKAPSTTKESRYRENMRRRGFRLVSMWVPDTRNATFRAELHRQAALIARHESLADRAFAESALADIEGWTV